MDGIIINDEVFKLVKDEENYVCDDCDLYKYCNSFGSPVCTAAFTFKECHFEKVEETPIKSKEQPETPSQTYFY